MRNRIPTFDTFINEEESEIEFKSPIDKKYNVMIIYPDSDYYEQITSMIPNNGLAVTDMRQKAMVINGAKIESENLTNDHLLFIQAHEIGHHYLNHKGEFGIPEQEKEADYAAYLLLKKKGYNKAAKLVIDFFKNRHGETFKDFEENHGNEIKEKIKQNNERKNTNI